MKFSMAALAALQAGIAPGAAFPPRELVGMSGERVRVPDRDRVTHLQLRRFAGCPICRTRTAQSRVGA